MTNPSKQFSDDEIVREIDVTGNGIIRYEGKEIFRTNSSKDFSSLRRTCQSDGW